MPTEPSADARSVPATFALSVLCLAAPEQCLEETLLLALINLLNPIIATFKRHKELGHEAIEVFLVAKPVRYEILGNYVQM